LWVLRLFAAILGKDHFMFDQLVETRKQRRERSTSVLVTTASIYAATLLAAAIVAVFSFNPKLSEASPKVVIYTTPSIGGVSSSPAGSRSVERVGIPLTRAVSPTRVPEHSAAKIRDLPAGTGRAGGLDLAVGTSGSGSSPVSGGGDVLPGLTTGETRTPVPPPPPPKKTEPAPPVKPTTTRVSEGVLQGSALQRVKPIYPLAAQHARVSGLVVVQVTISEEGRVTDAIVISGHPFLRDAAVQAARQWVFAPTMLSRVPVKVQGILSFNFTLQ
jgi:TonB family protein